METVLQFFKDMPSFLGNTLSAIIILIIGWFVARFLKKLTKKLITKTGIDKSVKDSKVQFAELGSKLVYFLLMVMAFMLALERLGMTNALAPLRSMLDEFIGFFPNLIGAGLVGYIGYMLATIVSEMVALSGSTIQKFTPKLKLPENINLVTILKKVVFIFIFIPLAITALNLLNMDAISEPATKMLGQFFDAIPRVLVATIILILFVVGGRFLSETIKDLLNSMNLNNFLNKMQLNDIVGNNNIVKLIGNLVYFFVVLIGLVTALEKLQFEQLTQIVDVVISYASKILFGLVILAIGNWIAGLAATNFAKKEENKFVSSVIRIAILSIFLAMGLKTMGLGDEIINLAFGISLGTVAITIALSFGLGGREAGGKQMERIIDKFNNKKDSKDA